MTESTPAPTELTSQYIAQVSGDLERNVKEQDRIRAEINALQEQLAALQQEYTVLVNVQRALGVTTAPAGPEGSAVPSPRAERGTGSRGKRRTRKATAAQGLTTARKSAATKTADTVATGTKTAQPTLVELIRRHLAEHSEPRSAAEISTALGQAHPELRIKTPVVRASLERLVAKDQAQRVKQGTSVYYTTPDVPEATPTSQTEAQPEDTNH